MAKRVVSRETLDYTLKLAEEGDSNAQYWMGAYYYKGRGVPRDLCESEKWFRKSAAAGNSNAQYHLGINFKESIGVEESVYWLKLAANNGSFYAQRFIGLLYFGGFFKKEHAGATIPTNKTEALKWMILANRRQVNFSSWVIFQFMKLTMRRNQKEEAKRLANAWGENRGRPA